VLASTMQHLSGSGGAGAAAAAAAEEEEEGYEQGVYDVLLDKRPPAGLGIYFVGEDDAEGSFVDPEEPFVVVARGEVNAAAASGAIRGGDELISVNGQDVSYLPFAVVVELLRELPPGRCSLRLRRAADDELGGGDGGDGGGGGGGGLRGQGAAPRRVEFSVRLDRARGSGLCIAFSEEQGRVVVDREEPFLPRADGGVGPAEASGEIRCVPCCACPACALAFTLRLPTTARTPPLPSHPHSPGDLLVAVGGRSVVGRPFDDVISVLRKRDEVELTFSRPVYA